MKAMFLGREEQDIKVFALAMQMRWPDSTLSMVEGFEDGLDALEKESPDVVLLHPASNGINLTSMIKQVRRCSTNVPLVVLGNGRDKMELVQCLELGADDYMKPPYVVAEIMARIWALLRRSINERGRTLQCGQLVINSRTCEAFLGELAVMLTAKEFRLLHLLVENQGAVVTHAMLQQALWGGSVAGGPKLLKRYIHRLRRKLKDDAKQRSWIVSVRGEGYRFIGPTPKESHEEALAVNYAAKE